MVSVLDYPQRQVAATFIDDAEEKYGQPQGKEGEKLRQTRARLAIPGPTDVAYERYVRGRNDHIYGIRHAIESSRALLHLEDNWDAEGSPAIAEDTWKRAVEFLENHADRIWRHHGIELDPPHVAPGPDGSIDLHWDLPDYELLINFPADPTAMADCYGDDRGRIRIRATFDPRVTNEGLLLWLKKATTELG